MKKRRAKSTVTRRGSLWFVALLLFGSAAFRVTESSDTLVAFAAETKTAMEPDSESPSGPATQPGNGIDLSSILDDLARREATLEEREALLEERMAALRLAEGEIRKNLVALEEAENQLRATMALAVTAAEDDLTRFTTVYENMKPKEAASLFEEMSPEFAAGFLARMRPDAAADIMVGLEPATAYSISVIMAGRNAAAPVE
jgi:flagellar motility protein MotE (MotC chaperone)